MGEKVESSEVQGELSLLSSVNFLAYEMEITTLTSQLRGFCNNPMGKIDLEETFESLLRPLGPRLSGTVLTSCPSDGQSLHYAHPVSFSSNNKAVLSVGSGVRLSSVSCRLSHLTAV